jgi:hypothetical protein
MLFSVGDGGTSDEQSSSGKPTADERHGTPEPIEP